MMVTSLPAAPRRSTTMRHGCWHCLSSCANLMPRGRQRLDCVWASGNRTALGGTVAEGAGWDFGVATTRFHTPQPWMTPTQPTLRLFSAHQAVVELPAGFEIIGGNEFCPNGALKDAYLHDAVPSRDVRAIHDGAGRLARGRHRQRRNSALTRTDPCRCTRPRVCTVDDPLPRDETQFGGVRPTAPGRILKKNVLSCFSASNAANVRARLRNSMTCMLLRRCVLASRSRLFFNSLLVGSDRLPIGSTPAALLPACSYIHVL